MRIVGGQHRGKRLSAPPGRDTRPTTDRVRENLFNILENRIDFFGIQVLDLFAGSGALGLEALSRGASFCLFVEHSKKASAVIRQNFASLLVDEQVKLIQRDATKLGSKERNESFDLVFADPPYSSGMGEKMAHILIANEWLSNRAIFVLEEDINSMPQHLPGFSTPDIRNYGQTSIGLFDVLKK